jgi:hypothetical protein
MDSAGCGSGVLVGGIGVAVGETGVLVGGAGVAVGAAVFVGVAGAGVLVGVGVLVAGTAVFVGVFVGGRGVLVGVLVGIAVLVAVGVGVGGGVLVGAGVSVGTCVAVDVGLFVKAGGTTVGVGCDAVQALSHTKKAPKNARNTLFATCDLTCSPHPNRKPIIARNSPRHSDRLCVLNFLFSVLRKGRNALVPL